MDATLQRIVSDLLVRLQNPLNEVSNELYLFYFHLFIVVLVVTRGILRKSDQIGILEK